jgi:hypothetical protein
MPRTLLVLVTLAVTFAAGLADPPAQTPPADQELPALRARVQAKLDELRSNAQFPGVGVGFVLSDGRSAGVA